MSSGRKMTFRFNEEPKSGTEQTADWHSRQTFGTEAKEYKAPEPEPVVIELLPYGGIADEPGYGDYGEPQLKRGRSWEQPQDKTYSGYGFKDDYKDNYADADNDRDFARYDYDESPGRQVGYGSSYQTRRPSHVWKFALAVAGAMGTGLLLGYAALSFLGGSGDSGASVNNGSAGTPVVDTSQASPAATDSSGPGAGQMPVTIAAQSYFLLQYGVFSTPEAAAQAKEELLAAGLAAGSDPEGGNRVYAGISPDREQAKLLSSGLKNQGIELYVREVTLPAADHVVFAGKAAAVESYFTASGRLLGELSRLSASLLSGEGGGAADTKALSDLHMQWTEAVKTLSPGVGAAGGGVCAELEKSMSRGIAALSEYNKNQAQGLLWEMQDAMMEFLAGQEKLLGLMTLNQT